MKGRLIVPGIVIVCVIAWGIHLYRKPHENAANIRASERISAVDLYGQFKKDEGASNKRFLDKVLEVRGVVTQVDHTDSTAAVQLDTGDPGASINCSFILERGEGHQIPAKNAVITIKGRCTGFLMDVNLVDCVFE
jgi:hypothetical protein